MKQEFFIRIGARRAHQNQPHQQSGISYIEVLIATILITITLVPALDALRPGLQGSALNRERTQIHHLLEGKMEQVLAQPFAELDAAATLAGAKNTKTHYSDTAAQIPYRVYIWRYDVDNADLDNNEFTGGEEDLLWVRVALKNNTQEIQTLISRY